MRRKTLLIAAVLIGAGPVFADGNKIYLTQDAPSTGQHQGNTISIDQTLADYSLIGQESAPALQTGRGNNASIVAEGFGAEILLRQDNNSVNGNVATLYAYGPVDAALTQTGEQNVADLSVIGPGMTGQILQDGNNNSAALNAIGIMGSATLEQIGSSIDADLNVEAYYGSVNYTLEGVNVRFANQGPTIRTFGQTINIRQYAVGQGGAGNGNSGNAGSSGNGNGP